MAGPVIEVHDLRTHFFTDEGVVRAVDGVNFDLRQGKVLAIVGESGCGKSVTAFSILQLISPPGRLVGGQIMFRRQNGDAVDLGALEPDSKLLKAIRGNDIAMIFQEPMLAFSPVYTIGNQISEVIRLHQGGRVPALRRAVAAADRLAGRSDLRRRSASGEYSDHHHSRLTRGATWRKPSRVPRRCTMMMTKTTLLVAAAFVAAPFAAPASGAEEATGEGQPAAAVPAGAYREAPMLTEMVACGELPPVDERLPSEPALLEPIESVGCYGGTLFVDATNNSPCSGAAGRHGMPAAPPT